MYKMSLVHLRIKPRHTCQHLHIGNYTKALNIILTHILAVKILTELSFFYIAHRKLYTFYVRNYNLRYAICIHRFQMP